MTPKKILGLIVFALIVTFITSADGFTFLPDPVRGASKTSREFLIGLVPDWLTPRNFNEERERDVEQLQNTTPANSGN
ncbi:hypothetical protein H4N54_01080 [Limnospira fusiformis KN01]|uniref:Uncharacterized protein n=3 Tax=Limnospira TaxID=2596745 RepID=A0A9P1P0M2_9CYAN|nr:MULTISPECIES: hypothetical protein [Limnospira]EKD09314.1 hypothetical protein SPLC1_S207160 [Arthrospira platensis C1]MDC0837295.1 hypothetical protein [Limnoraphis robusta]MDY7052280.1 hypothetical protein [Limnospira fusiformis LS22]QJB24699.1 hypothetical protein HFV01_01485 [Limnospira fusiformis SAG 85.79]EDZ92910.1 conserved hypothetical protein [Limnospira maxima CS-328]